MQQHYEMPQNPSKSRLARLRHSFLIKLAPRCKVVRSYLVLYLLHHNGERVSRHLYVTRMHVSRPGNLRTQFPNVQQVFLNNRGPE